MYFVVAYAYSGLSPVRVRPWRANTVNVPYGIPYRTFNHLILFNKLFNLIVYSLGIKQILVKQLRC